MAYKSFYTEDALVDLEILLDYISVDNAPAAQRFGEALLNHVELLREFQEMGLPVLTDF